MAADPCPICSRDMAAIGDPLHHVCPKSVIDRIDREDRLSRRDEFYQEDEPEELDEAERLSIGLAAFDD